MLISVLSLLRILIGYLEIDVCGDFQIPLFYLVLFINFANKYIYS